MFNKVVFVFYTFLFQDLKQMEKQSLMFFMPLINLKAPPPSHQDAQDNIHIMNLQTI